MTILLNGMSGGRTSMRKYTMVRNMPTSSFYRVVQGLQSKKDKDEVKRLEANNEIIEGEYEEEA